MKAGDVKEAAAAVGSLMVLVAAIVMGAGAAMTVIIALWKLLGLF